YFCTHDYFWHSSLGLGDSLGLYQRDLAAQLKDTVTALNELQANGTSRGFLRLIALQAAMESSVANQNIQAEALAKQAVKLTREAWAGGSYNPPAEEELLVGHFFREPYWRRAGDYPPELRDDVEKAALSDWAQSALLGVCDSADRLRAIRDKNVEKVQALRKS